MIPEYDIFVHIPSLHGGGAERVAIEISRYFSENKSRVAVFTHHRHSDYEIPDGVAVYTAKSRSHAARVLEFRYLLKKTRTPIVLSFLPYANLLSILATVGLQSVKRLVVSEHLSYSALKPPELKQRFKLALACFLYRRADAIIAVSRGVAAELKSRLDVRTARKVTVIYNPCFIPDASVHSELTRRRDAAIVLAVGRLVHQKGFDVLIRAFARVKVELADAVLRIIGEGQDRAELEKLIGELGICNSVVLPGFTKHIGSEYAKSDVFVCASRAEGFGNVIVEALSYGLTVVSTECPSGPAEILNGGQYGLLVPVENEEALAAAILQQYRNRSNPESQVARAREFSLNSIGQQYALVLNVQ